MSRFDVRELRPRLARYLRPVRKAGGSAASARRRARYFRDGIEGICVELRTAIDCVPILREFGAVVGPDTVIYGPLFIMNADGDFSRLRIGHDVYIGTATVIDLADFVTIGDFSTVSARCNLITHIDVGPGPLRERRPPKRGPVVIEDGAYLGAGVTVLHGVTIGAEATIGASCLIRKAVEARSTWVSPEAVELGF